ncbi:hypothetical protein BURMUCGD2_5973 [Burkholderia multivorans CGD2]|uniref:Uncharacterized protein n=1 Tax=Burkholderia multivorans CGD2 TaxID=513052 RepID=B9BLL5_9BURK|nr:hypothetical protein BURMUCGD2_5973 [Burkholderia multivorans CGD2]
MTVFCQETVGRAKPRRQSSSSRWDAWLEAQRRRLAPGRDDAILVVGVDRFTVNGVQRHDRQRARK